MATAKITKQAVDATHPGTKDKLLWDTKLAGFGLKVTPAGSKVFIYQYRLGGRGSKVRRYTIGKLGVFTPDKARSEAERLARLVAQGTDPQGAKVERQRQAVVLAFDSYLDRFERERLKVGWKSTSDEVRAMLDRYALPVLRDKPLSDVTRADLSAVLAPVRDRPASAAKLFAVLRHLFKWAISEGDLAHSPMDGMNAPKGPAGRDRYLSDGELLLVWKASGEMGYPFGPLVRLLILTGARRDEVSGMSWDELRQGDSLWSLPAVRAKNGNAAEIPLSSLATAAITELAGKVEKWPRRGLLFSTTGKTAVSGYSRAKKRLDTAIEKLNDGEALDHWTFHDLRRTFATGMQRLGVRFEVTEAILNHVSGSRSGVAGIYQRHDWKPEKKAALQAWSDHVERLLSGADETNVVQLAEVRA